MIRGPLLKRNLDKKIRVKGGDYSLDPNQQAVVLRGVTAHTADGGQSDTSCGALEEVALYSHSEVVLEDRIAFIQPHPDLEYAGILTGPRVIDDAHRGALMFKFVPDEDFDLAALPYFVKLYLSGDEQ